MLRLARAAAHGLGARAAQQLAGLRVTPLAPLGALQVGAFGQMHARMVGYTRRPEQAPASDDRLLTLHNIADNDGARKKQRRYGRGPGSGRGKTAGRGMNGLYARRNLGARHYEGGQSPLYRRSPKRGMLNDGLKQPLDVVNLWKLGMFVRNGRIDPAKPITLKVLKDSGVIGNSRVRFGIKLLANGKDQLQGLPPLNIEVTHASELAKKTVSDLGGSVKFVFMNRMGLRAHLFPEKFHPALMPRSLGVPKATKAHRYDNQDEDKYLNPHPRAVAAHEKKVAIKNRRRERDAAEATRKALFAQDAKDDAEFEAARQAAEAEKKEALRVKYGRGARKAAWAAMNAEKK